MQLELFNTTQLTNCNNKKWVPSHWNLDTWFYQDENGMTQTDKWSRWMHTQGLNLIKYEPPKNLLDNPNKLH